MSSQNLYSFDHDLNKFLEIQEFLEDTRTKSYEALFQLFQLDVEKMFEEEFIVLKQLRMSPLDLDEMEYYRYWYLLKNFMKYIEEEKAAREKEEKGQNSIIDQKQMMNDAKKGIPGMSGGGSSSPSLPKIPGLSGGGMPNMNSLSRGFKI